MADMKYVSCVILIIVIGSVLFSESAPIPTPGKKAGGKPVGAKPFVGNVAVQGQSFIPSKRFNYLSIFYLLKHFLFYLSALGGVGDGVTRGSLAEAPASF